MGTIVTGTTRVTGLFGHPVSHSLSPTMQNAAFEDLGLDYIYITFDVHPDDLEAAVQSIRVLGLVGVNVTIPHKERVLAFLDWISEDARQIGSVNTILNSGGILKGYSTDGPGFIKDLKTAGIDPSSSRVAVLGAGGAARATVYSLASQGASVQVLNRTHSRAVELAMRINEALKKDLVVPVSLESVDARNAVKEADLLVNCTSVGMYPNVDALPIQPEWLHEGFFVYDQVYSPPETALLRAARAVGARGVNGAGMLVEQGAMSFEIWTGKSPSIEVMKKVVLAGAAGNK